MVRLKDSMSIPDDVQADGMYKTAKAENSDLTKRLALREKSIAKLN